MAKLPYPQVVDPIRKISPKYVLCRCYHPDYAEMMEIRVDMAETTGDNVTTVTVPRGAQVEITALANDKPLPIDGVYAAWNNGGLGIPNRRKVSTQGRLQLPRFQPGIKQLLVAYVPKDGPMLFSEFEMVELKDQEKRDLRIALKPGVVVSGRLDDHVPRPVKNGRVVGQVIASLNAEWRDSATIKEDGSFTLGPFPHGDLQLIALCDGYMAQSGVAPDFVPQALRSQGGYLRPQVFALTKENAAITLLMTPTADCHIRVLDSEGRPAAGARYQTPYASVGWWNGGSQGYCDPLYSSLERLTQPTDKSGPSPSYFYGTTDAQGELHIGSVPPSVPSFLITYDKTFRSARVQLKAGSKAEITVKLPAKDSKAPVATEVLQGDFHDDTGLLAKPAPPKMFATDAKETELTGVVTDESGAPLSGVKVDAWTWHPGNETVTDKDGRFLLPGFEPGEALEVEFTKDAYSPSLFVRKKAGTPNWVVVLTQGTWLEGKVLDPKGQAMSKALVRASRGPYHNPQVMIGEVWSETHADDTGHYRLHLEPSTYDVQVRVPGTGAVRHQKVALQSREKKQLDLQLNAGVTFHAAVRNSATGKPVGGIVLWNWLHPDIEGTSDERGNLEIPGMMDGEFEFNVSAVGVDRKASIVAGDYARWWSASAVHEHQRANNKDRNGFQRNFDSLTFNLQGADANVEVFVEPAVSITGRVLDPDGHPVAGATVAPAKTGTGNSLTGDTRFSYRTDKDGRFTMKLPASGVAQYNLVAHDGDYNEWRNWANGSGENLKTEPGQKLENVELKLARPGTVRGQALGNFGKPRPHIKVRAAAVDMRDNRYYMPTTTTDEAGRYELRFVAPGEHFIQTEPFWLSATDAPKEASRVVTVKSAAIVENVDFSARMVSGGERGTAVGERVGPGVKSCWSPDGNKLVITKVVLGSNDAGLEIRDLVSGKSRDLLTSGKDPAWSPAADGLIAFVRGLQNEEVWVVRPDGTGEHRIAPGRWPHWSGDGKTLYFDDVNSRQIVAVSVARLEEPHAVCSTLGFNWDTVSPDGSKVAFFNTARGLVVETCPDREPVRAFPYDGSRIGGGGGLVGWHPDGKRIAYGSMAGVMNPTGLWLADLETGKTRKIVGGKAWKPAWSKDGKQLLYLLDNDVYIVDADKLPAP
jgi:protocatechuate 3,4-dioxygenase beta subunit